MESISGLIIRELDAVVGRTPKEVGDALGLSSKGQQALRMQFRRMEQSGRVKRVGYGKYTVAEPVAKIPTSSEVVEQALVEYLVEHGSVAKTGDIFRGLGWRKDSYERVLAVQILRRSPHFTQDYGRGFWCLRPGVTCREGIIHVTVT